MRKLVPLLCLVILSRAAALFAQGTPETIKVGFVGDPYNYGAFSLANLAGLEFAAKRVNSAGGLLGQQVEIVVKGDTCGPETAAGDVAREFLDEGVILVFGFPCADSARKALEAFENRALLMSSLVSDPSLSGEGHPYFFRTIPPDDYEARLIAGLVKKNAYKKALVVNDGDDRNAALARQIQGLLAAGGPDAAKTEVLAETIAPGAESYDALAKKLRRPNPDVAIFLGKPADAAKFALNLKAAKLAPVMVGPVSLFDDDFPALGGEAVEGSYVVGKDDILLGPEARAALEDNGSRRAEATAIYYVYSVGAAQALFEAIAKARTPFDLALVKRHLNEDTVLTAMGPTRFDANGDIEGGAGHSLHAIQHGKFVIVEP
ncbi:MAG: branched-chain amino acid ABC transporter substrate-binding protein [Deltaproteobacteria bacterium]|jgi:branched-chain amino acid transport system substrate-binding protein|nr:branched-chain amino acid ABC transporter substrate-binding protein [Deltaproteobacteria bacterium]